MPAIIATIVAVGTAGLVFIGANGRTEAITGELRMHSDALISLEKMRYAAVETQIASTNLIKYGRPEDFAVFSEASGRVQLEHDKAQQIHRLAEGDAADGHNATQQEIEDLFQECEAGHRLLTGEVQQLIDQGTIVAGVGAQGIDSEKFISDLTAGYDRMAEVDGAIEEELDSDRGQLVVDLNAAQATATRLALGAGVFAIALGFCIAYISSKKLVLPVRRMSQAAKRLADGDMGQTIEVSGNDELAGLGRTFNSMASALERRTRQLEQEKASIRSIHQSIGDGIVVFDNRGTILSVNPAAEKALGMNSIDLEGKRDIGIDVLQAELDRPPIDSQSMAKCWEVKQCTHPECPSYESSERRCWLQCGTCCHNQIQGTFRQKRDACERCDVFQFNATRQFELPIGDNFFSGAIIPVLDDQGQQEGRTLVLHDITEMTRGRQELERHSSEMEKLQSLTNAVSGSLDLEGTLAAGTREICKAGDYAAAAVYLVDGRDGDLRLASIDGFDGDPPEDMLRLNRRIIPAGAVESAEPLVIGDLRRYRRLAKSMVGRGMLSAVIIPLLSSDSSLMGALCVSGKRLDAFNSDQVRLLRLMAGQISIAASNAMLYEDRVRHSEKMSARNRIVSTLTSSMVFDDMFDAFVGEVGRLVDFDRASIVLLNRNQTAIEQIFARGGCPMDKDGCFRLPGSVVESMVHNRQAINRGDLANQRSFSWDSALIESGINSSLNLPLQVEGRLVGTMNFCSDAKDAFSEDVVEELKPIADQLALAAANYNLFQHIAQAKAEWEATFDAVGEGIVVVNNNHIIVRLNQAAAEMLGATVGELTGESCRKRLHQVISSSSTCALVDPAPGKPSVRSEVELPNGRTLEVMIDAVFDENSNFTGGVHFLRDITESKQMRGRLVTSEKMVAVGQLVSGVAHEINNPLTGITGYAQLLMMREDLDEKTRKDAEAIAGEADRATRIVRQLLSFAREHQVERAPVNINDVVRDCLGLKGYDLKVNNVEVRTELESSLPDIPADRYQLQQVFINLITNAEQAIHENGKTGVLEIITATDGDNVRAVFTDSGPGVAPEIKSRLFDPFFTTKEVGKGTGLGLSVCFGIVQEHRGAIWAEEAPAGTGARFVVELPVRIDATISETHESESAAVKPGKILLVDDEESVRSVLRETLSRAGHEVDVASNGEAALEQIRKNDYDCIVSDVKMPVMNGAELHQAAKKLKPETAGRFIFISGDTVNEETRDYLAGLDRPSLNKPFSLQELQTLLLQVLEEQRPAA
ncbi:MAG: GAF domain-containing protein [Thermoleophilia bacterium]